MILEGCIQKLLEKNKINYLYSTYDEHEVNAKLPIII